MKNFLTIFCICMSALFASAQYTPLVSENNYWKCLSYGWGTQYFDYYLNGDSTLMGVQYKKVYVKDAQQNVNLYGLIRENMEEQKVIINIYLSEKLLYDFSLEVNDTATVYGVGDYHQIVVTDVTTVIVNGTERKKIVFDELNGWSPGYWIEGVGSVYGLPDAALGQITDYSPVLSCFYEGNNLAWDNPDNEDLQCGSTLATIEIGQATLHVFPNPAAEYLQISLSENTLLQALKVEVVSLTGQTVLVTQTYTGRLDISNLPSGVYAICLRNNDVIIGNASIVKF